MAVSKGSIVKLHDGSEYAVAQRFSTAVRYLQHAGNPVWTEVKKQEEEFNLTTHEQRTIDVDTGVMRPPDVIKFDLMDGGRLWIGPEAAAHAVVREVV